MENLNLNAFSFISKYFKWYVAISQKCDLLYVTEGSNFDKRYIACDTFNGFFYYPNLFIITFLKFS